MDKIITINFSLCANAFSDSFNEKLLQMPDFNTIEIHNVSTAMNGLKIISQEWFRNLVCYHKNLIRIYLKINDILDESFDDKPHIFDFEMKESILIVFQSTQEKHSSKIFWKISGRERFYSLFIKDDADENITFYCHHFLMREIMIGNSGKCDKNKNNNNV